MRLGSLLFVFLVLFACTKQNKKSSFVEACSIAQKFNWNQRLAKEQLRSDFANQVQQSLAGLPAAQAIGALSAFEESQVGERYKMFQQAATDSGEKNFECPILKENF